MFDPTVAVLQADGKPTCQRERKFSETDTGQERINLAQGPVSGEFPLVQRPEELKFEASNARGWK